MKNFIRYTNSKKRIERQGFIFMSFWTCLLSIIAFFLDFGIAALIFGLIVETINFVLYKYKTKIIDDGYSNFSSEEKLKIENALKHELHEERDYIVTKDFIIDTFHHCLIPYNEILLIHKTKDWILDGGKHGKILNVVFVYTKDREFEFINDDRYSTFFDLYKYIKTQNPMVLDDCSRDSLKKLEHIRMGESNELVERKTKNNKFRIVGWILMLVSIIWFFCLFTKIDISLWFSIFMILFISGIILVMRR